MLDRKKLSYVLFGHIQSDCIEGRFGWSRQLSGGNYFNSVLQFVQAEKKIRVKCLVKMGYLMNEVKEIFQSSDDARTREINIAVDDILRKISEFDFEFKFMVDSSDEATVYYTAGAIVRCLLRQKKCSSCIKLNNNETINIKITDRIVESDERQFLSLCNRGGLTKPSDLVFIACVHSWSLYCFLFNDPELWDIVISSYNPREVFTQVYLKELSLSANTEKMLKEKCDAGCLFKDKIKQIAVAAFNLKAKNYTEEANDAIRDQKNQKKRTHDDSREDYKQFRALRKVKKLTFVQYS